MTKTYQIAHIHKDGQDIIIFPLESLDSRNDMELAAICDSLQFFATDAGLKGIVCIVWQRGGVFKYLAPREWQPFFDSIGSAGGLALVQTMLNRTLTCSYQ
jgi:hypothetical protein